MKLCSKKGIQEPPELVFLKSCNNTESLSTGSQSPNLSMKKKIQTTPTTVSLCEINYKLFGPFFYSYSL